ncbi:MAG TPA: hypothetical protein VGE74_29855, partial [Gemmata sp.]
RQIDVSQENGEHTLAFRTKRQIANPVTARNCAAAAGLTCGLSECIAFPWQVCETMRTALFGRAVEVRYDAQGSVLNVFVEGHGVYTR